MIQKVTSKTNVSNVIFIVLLSLSGLLAALLVIGTIYALARSSDTNPIIRLGKSIEAEQAKAINDIRVFSGIGRLRIPLSDSSVMILSMAFPYSADDIAFTEELAAKIGSFRMIASDYFSSLSAEKLIVLDEDAAKHEILGRINSDLRLGHIEALYFSDFLILDSPDP